MSENYIWRCDGICRTRKPTHGWFYNVEDRSPDSTYRWWTRHQRTCGGTFHKLSKADVARECELDSGSPLYVDRQAKNRNETSMHATQDGNIDFEEGDVTSNNQVRNTALIREISLDTGRDSDSIIIIDEDCHEFIEVPNESENQFKFINDGIGMDLFKDLQISDITHNRNEFLICALCNEKLLNEQIYEHLKACTGLCLKTIEAKKQLAIFILPFYKFNSNTN